MKKLVVILISTLIFGCTLSHAQDAAIGNDKPDFYMSIKTNLLSDAMALPSLGLEFAIEKRFSIAAQWHYAWWSNPKRALFWQSYGGDMAVRWWFGREASEKPLTGHHIGLYGQMLTYDFELGKTGYQAPDWNYGGGFEYGYSLPLTERLNMDFCIGIGYLGGKYMEYTPKDDRFIWQVTRQMNWFGPTKAEISLVWLLGKGNINRRK